ncbi:type II secretion system protein GspJ [Anaeromyxobacter paludicola]|uniref:Type II secretion system protein J n=1 Tax=Anaeromyxobacter paludicola TaxID=2918171 RepID=A0ABN6NAE9_9BACT|nr:type II secretion system protein GspJ [Anaeromyxobacter paludicola]BDG08985.1 type II secretory pathway [Anaeromyxobacter paludicola]
MRRGFTLIEVMIAIGISAVIGVMALGSFQRAHAARELTQAQEERFGGARRTLTRMARELSMAYLSEHYDHKRFRERPTLFRGKDGGRRDALLFTSFSHQRLVRDAKESDQALLEYTVDSDPERPGKLALFRREKVHLDEDPDRGGDKQLVLQNVAGFDAQFWDWKKQEWVNDWVSSSVERQGTLPTRVKVRLTLEMPDGKEENFETQARVAIIRPLDF